MGLLKRTLGKLLNASGTPGFIRAQACHDRLGVPIEVRVDDLFTVIVVNNIRLMFHRITGSLDGIVLDPADCRRGATRETSRP